MNTKSHLGKTFLIESSDARVRQDKDPLSYVTYAAGDEDIPPGRKVGDPRLIPQGTTVKITDAKSIVTDKGKKPLVFAEPAGEGEGAPFGWTAAANLHGGFVGETIGEKPPADSNKKGPNAAWDAGTYIGQKTLVEIVGNEDRTKRVILDNLDAYLAMTDAASKGGVTIALNSGFRSYPEQESLYKRYQADPVNNAQAAAPGNSNHQDGQAFDIEVGGYDGHPAYDWLKANGPKMGFIRTVNKEPWHWEYRPSLAAKMAAKGEFKLAKVKK